MQASIEIQQAQEPPQIILYFSFSNHSLDTKDYLFTPISTVSENNQRYIDSVAQFLNKLSSKVIANKKTFLNAIKGYFSNKEKLLQTHENFIKTYLNTALILQELFEIQKFLQLKTFFDQLIVESEGCIKQLGHEIDALITTQEDATLHKTSLIPEKKLSTNKIEQIQTVNHFFYTTKALEVIFSKINTLIRWHYLLEKITPEASIGSIEGDLRHISARLAILCDLFIKQARTPQTPFQTQIQAILIDQIMTWIEKNKTVIDSLTKRSRHDKYLYLQTSFIFKPLDKKIEGDNEYKYELHEYFKNLALIITKDNNQINEFMQLYFILKELQSNQFEQTINTAYKNIITDKTNLLNQKIDSITSKISRFWVNQLKEKNPALTLLEQSIQHLYNGYRRSHYFFGFSLITYSRQNSATNRYTYMVIQLEEIFELVNELIHCNSITIEVNQKLNALITSLKIYQKHFFMNAQKESLLKKEILLPKPDQTDLLVELANNNRESNALQVGIECAIIDQIIAWIEENQNIILTKLKEEFIAERTLFLKNTPKFKRVLQNNNHSE
jgi:hypothetical protein